MTLLHFRMGWKSRVQNNLYPSSVELQVLSWSLNGHLFFCTTVNAERVDWFYWSLVSMFLVSESDRLINCNELLFSFFQDGGCWQRGCSKDVPAHIDLLPRIFGVDGLVKWVLTYESNLFNGLHFKIVDISRVRPGVSQAGSYLSTSPRLEESTLTQMKSSSVSFSAPAWTTTWWSIYSLVDNTRVGFWEGNIQGNPYG